MITPKKHACMHMKNSTEKLRQHACKVSYLLFYIERNWQHDRVA